MQDDEQVTAPEADASAPGDMNGYRMLLFRASHAQRQLMHPFMASIGLGTGQPKLLSYLAEYGSSSPRDMADFYELDPAGVSRMLDALAGKGFVKIEPHAADRRSKVVSLTPEGARVACAWNAACAEEAEAMLAGFTPEEREAFADYLRRAPHQPACVRQQAPGVGGSGGRCRGGGDGGGGCCGCGGDGGGCEPGRGTAGVGRG